MANLDLNSLQQNLGKIVLSDAYKRALANKGLDYNDLSLFGFTNSTGLKIKDVFNDMNTAVEGGDDGNMSNNSISQSRYDQIGKQLYFKTTDGTIIQYNIDNGAVTTENANDFINNANSNGFFGTVNGQNNQVTSYDRLHFGNNSVTAIDYVFGASQSDLNAKYGKVENYQAIAVDATNTTQMAQIIKDASAEDGGFKGLKSIFGTEDGTTTYSDKNGDEMLINQNDHRYLVKYDETTGKVTTTQVDEPNLTDQNSITNFKNLVNTMYNDFGYKTLEQIFSTPTNGLSAQSSNYSKSYSVTGQTKDGGKYYVQGNTMYLVNTAGDTFVIGAADKSGNADTSQGFQDLEVHNYSLNGKSVTGDNLSWPADKTKITNLTQESYNDLGANNFEFFKVFGKNDGIDKNILYSTDASGNKVMYVVGTDNKLSEVSIQNGTAVASDTIYTIDRKTNTITGLNDAATNDTTTPASGKFNIPAADVASVYSLAGGPNATQDQLTKATETYLHQKYGNDSLTLLQSVTKDMGYTFNNTTAQEFLAKYRDLAVTMISSQIASQMKTSKVQLGTNVSATVYNNNDVNLNNLSSTQKTTLADATKVSDSEYQTNSDYKSAFTNYVQGKTNNKTVSSNDITVDAAGNVNVNVKVNITAAGATITLGSSGNETVVLNTTQMATIAQCKDAGEVSNLLHTWLLNTRSGSKDANTTLNFARDNYAGGSYWTKASASGWADSELTSMGSALYSQVKAQAGNISAAPSGTTEAKTTVDGMNVDTKTTTTVGNSQANLNFDPMQFADKNFDYTFVDDENKNGKFDGESELMGYDKNWADMQSYDTNGDGAITGDELDKLMLLRTDKKTGKTVVISAKDAGLKSIDLKSHKDTHKVINSDQTEIGEFEVDMNDGTKEEATQTSDSKKYLDDYTKSILKGMC